MPSSKKMSVVQAKEKIREAMAELQSVGRTVSGLDDVAKWAGYEGITTAEFHAAVKELKAFREAVKELRAEGKMSGKKGEVVFTEQEEMEDDEKEEDLQVKMLDKVLKDPAEPIPVAWRTVKVFNQLMDGLAHQKQILARTAGYENVETKKFRCLVNRMKMLGLVEVKGVGPLATVQFTHDVFPVGGRPVDGVARTFMQSPDVTKRSGLGKNHKKRISLDNKDGDSDSFDDFSQPKKRKGEDKRSARGGKQHKKTSFTEEEDEDEDSGSSYDDSDECIQPKKGKGEHQRDGRAGKQHKKRSFHEDEESDSSYGCDNYQPKKSRIRPAADERNAPRRSGRGKNLRANARGGDIEQSKRGR